MSDVELNFCIALKVMGWHLAPKIRGYPDLWLDANEEHSQIAMDWQPTSDIAQAWQVVEKMKGMGYGWNAELDIADYDTVWIFWKQDGDDEAVEYLYSSDKSPSRAIVLAALRALSGQVTA